MKAEGISQGWSMLSPEELKSVHQQALTEFTVLADENALSEASQFHKALADTTRLRVVALLAVTDLCLCHLVDTLSVPSSTMTHHLQMLERGGVIVSRRDGKFTVYALHPDRKAALIRSLQPQP